MFLEIRDMQNIQYISGAKRSLTLTTCFPDKFTCDDGSCVRINQRCNLAVDCRDESDEKVNFC